jgi:hypothetical protein
MIDIIKTAYIYLHEFMCGYEAKNDEKTQITSLKRFLQCIL